MSDTPTSTKKVPKKSRAKVCRNCGHEMKRVYIQAGYVKTGVAWVCWKEIVKALRYRKSTKHLDFNILLKIDQHAHLKGARR